ncbi:MAG: glycosyltransferase family 4 protein [Anaerolineae bacterium]|nr:glycosyltransferase family 4 protein [Anaerolineae bacterium]
MQHLIQQGHEVTVCSILDQKGAEQASKTVPLLDAVGARFEPLVYKTADVSQEIAALTTSFSGKARYLLGLAKTDIYIHWLRLHAALETHLRRLALDAVLIYDFPSLAAAYGVHVVPKLAVAVDLWHLDILSRSEVRVKQSLSLQKLKELVQIRQLANLHRNVMIQVLRDCEAQIDFAAHHAEWLRQHGVPSLEYLQTPIEDPIKATAASLDLNPRQNPKPRLLMIGNLTGVATRLGFQLLGDSILPELERALGEDAFEIRVVGEGTLPAHIRRKLERPAMKWVGRVDPPDAEFLGADIVLVTTPVEIGMRVRIAVAFAYGCCVVAHVANAAGIPEMKHDHNALIGHNGQELAAQIVRALKDLSLQSTLRHNARSTFEDYFKSDVAAIPIANRLVELVRNNTPVQKSPSDLPNA